MSARQYAGRQWAGRQYVPRLFRGVSSRTLVGSSDVVTQTGSGAGFDKHYSRDRGYLPYQFVEPKQTPKRSKSFTVRVGPIEVVAVDVRGYGRFAYAVSQPTFHVEGIGVPGVNFSFQSVSFRLNPVEMVATIGLGESIEIPAFSVNATDAEFVSQMQIIEDDAFVAGMLAGMEVWKRR